MRIKGLLTSNDFVLAAVAVTEFVREPAGRAGDIKLEFSVAFPVDKMPIVGGVLGGFDRFFFCRVGRAIVNDVNFLAVLVGDNAEGVHILGVLRVIGVQK